MPKYQFHRLPAGGRDARPVEMVLYNDTAAIRRAIGEEFPEGCEVWQGPRFVGRFHGAVRIEPPGEVAPDLPVLPAAARAGGEPAPPGNLSPS